MTSGSAATRLNRKLSTTDCPRLQIALVQDLSPRNLQRASVIPRNAKPPRPSRIEVAIGFRAGVPISAERARQPVRAAWEENVMPHRNKIRVSQPDLSARERQYLLEAFDSSWISSTGPFVSRFEKRFAGFADVGHAISCVNGTAAMHLALMGLGIGPGDEVIVPAMTYIASANVIRYVGAEPVLADCDPNTWTISPDSISRLITPRTRAIIAVHLLGVPADMDAVKNLADDHGLAVIEDAAEAHGATVNGKPVGSLGDVSAFSFYGNKILSTGEGGMVCTNRGDLAERMRLLRGQGARRDRCYQFDEVGYNYRMTNLACAIGLAQLERFDELRARREMVRTWYDRALNDARLPVARQRTTRRSASVLWIYGIVLKESVPIDRDALRQRLADDGIETRPFFPALNTQRIYADCRNDEGCAVSRHLGQHGIMLPTHSQLTEGDADRVVGSLAAALQQPVGAS